MSAICFVCTTNPAMPGNFAAGWNRGEVTAGRKVVQIIFGLHGGNPSWLGTACWTCMCLVDGTELPEDVAD